MSEKEYDSAIVFLKKAFEAGQERPMQIVTDSNFYPLTDDPDYRPQIRSLIESFTTENQATMVRENEKGEPITIRGAYSGRIG